MCPPIIAAAGIAASVIGTATSAIGAMNQGQAQQQQANYQAQVARNNATVASQNATLVQQQAEARAQSDQRAGDQRLGAQRAAIGAAGGALGSGSALDVQGSTVTQTGLSTANDDYDGRRAAYGYQVQGSNFGAQAGLDTAAGANAGTAGTVNAFGSLLGGASQVAGKWASYQQSSNYNSSIGGAF